MSDTQLDAYGDAERVDSEPLGIIDRENRNHKKKQRLILEHTAAVAGDRVLEVGVGSGYHAAQYADRFDYVGIDISPSLVKHARERADTDEVYQMDAMDLAFRANRFDAVVGTAVLHHMHDPTAALSEWLRVVRPGGSITLMEPNLLFPKDLLGTLLIPEEEHAWNMLPWRLASILDDATGNEATWTVDNRIYMPPWPASLGDVYDGVESICRRVPVLRRGSQMQLIHIEAEK